VALPPLVEEIDSDDVDNDVDNAREELMYMMVLTTEERGDVRTVDEYVGVSA
jgi:hypothetical protein